MQSMLRRHSDDRCSSAGRWQGAAVLLVMCFTGSAGVRAADPPATIVVRQDGVILRTRPNEHSQSLRTLEVGQVLEPVAGLDGARERWYFVRTKNGAQGWVLANQVEGSSRLERTLRKGAFVPGRARRSGTSLFASSPYDTRTTRVPIQMNGGAIFVPVRLNRSLETRMMMDTGATLTLVTPRLARTLRLKPGSRITLATANGPISAPVANLSSLRVGNAEVRDIAVAIHDFAPGARVGGLLGLNFLRRFETSVDSENQFLTLKPN